MTYEQGTSRHLRTHTHSHHRSHTHTYAHAHSLTRQWRQAGVWSRKPSGWRKWRSPPSSLSPPDTSHKYYRGLFEERATTKSHRVLVLTSFRLSEYQKIDYFLHFLFPPGFGNIGCASGWRFLPNSNFVHRLGGLLPPLTGCSPWRLKSGFPWSWRLSDTMYNPVS